MWIYYGIAAGFILGFYDFWTKKAMADNGIFPVVFFSSFFGALFWVPAFIPFTYAGMPRINIDGIHFHEQLIIFVKSTMMTLSWVFAYFSVRELPMSFSGSVRASGPLWTLAGGSLIFGEFLTPIQLTAVVLSVICYYFLSQIGKKEGINTLRSLPMTMMLLATILSSFTTVYDKFIVQQMGMSVYTVQAYSALHRFIIATALLVLSIKFRQEKYHCKWSLYIPLVGLSWVIAELVYFFAISDASANVTYLSIFRRMSLVVGFILSALFIGEKYFLKKLTIILLIVFSAVLLIFKF
ncbi:EamA family transporter [Prodigiosinella aquatilis]|nr:EamA family transporter [Prodigiosinella sp. LS101]WJV54053.1 EamA family transporter [Prodigiosinella sp. LS101]WJV58414.1 EamA family transporter [Pectobacteriaceae bacterium C111]